MSVYESTEVESTAVKPRLRRAITEKMTAIHDDGDIYSVTSQSGHEYQVDAHSGACTCPDAQHNLDNGELCKHALRVLIVRGDRVIPAAIDRDTVDPLLGCAVDTTPLAVATDGGTTTAATATDDETQTRERPADCDCGKLPGEDLPCWPCYRDYFETPNPNTNE